MCVSQTPHQSARFVVDVYKEGRLEGMEALQHDSQQNEHQQSRPTTHQVATDELLAKVWGVHLFADDDG